MISQHVRSHCVVVIDELADNVIEISLAPNTMNLSKHSHRRVPMNSSHLPFKFGLALGNEFVRTLRDFSLSEELFVNVLSLSCTLIATTGQLATQRQLEKATKASA